MSPRPLDAVDLALLEALQLDGRAAIKALAHRVGLSPSACLARVRRLEEAGVIRRYLADLRGEAVGPLLVIHAEVTLAQHRAEDFAAFDRAIAGIAEIVEALQVSGAADYVMRAVVPDIEAWSRISDALVDRGVRIESVRTSVVMKVAKRYAGLPLRSLARGPETI